MDDPTLRAALNAPLDDEPFTDEERAAVEEAYQRLARLHYALSTADSVSDALHRRAIDDLMDVLETLEQVMPPRGQSKR